MRSLFQRNAAPDSRSLAAIDRWVCPFDSAALPASSVHLLAGLKDWRLAAWTLASWCHFTESAWRIVIHDDGTLSPDSKSTLLRIFPSARIISRAEAEAALHPILAPFPFAETLHADDPAAVRLFDTAHFSAAEKFFVFSPGLLFFNYPRELIDWAARDEADSWFTESPVEKSRVTAAEARSELGVEVWPRVDDGIWMLGKSALDLDFIDTVLAQTSILRGTLEHATHTLAMLCAARASQGGLLPRHFEVSENRHASDDAVARYYDPAQLARFVSDGLRRVTPHLFPPDAA